MQNPVGAFGDFDLPTPLRNWLRSLISFIKSRYKVKFVTTTYTVEEEIYFVSANAVGGAFTVTLPSAVNRLGREIIIKRMNAGGNAVTLGGTIDGAVNPALAAQYAYKRVLSDGTNWNDVT